MTVASADTQGVNRFRRAEFWTGAIAAGTSLLAGYAWLLTRTTTIADFRHNVVGEPLYLLGAVYFFPVFMVLFSLNAGALITLRRVGVVNGAASGTAMVVGAVGAGCPVCGAFLLSLVGVTAGLASFPLGGFEVWMVAAVIMALTLRSSARRMQRACDDGTCTIARAHGRAVPMLLLAIAAVAGAITIALIMAHAGSSGTPSLPV